MSKEVWIPTVDPAETGRTGLHKSFMENRRAVHAYKVIGQILRKISCVFFIRSWSMTIQSRVEKPEIRHGYNVQSNGTFSANEI